MMTALNRQRQSLVHGTLLRTYITLLVKIKDVARIALCCCKYGEVALADRAEATAAELAPLQIPVRLAPPVLINDISERDTANWPEPPNWVPNRQQGIGVHIGRQPERSFHFLLEL
jgi:hypothetical protein